jgi:hypothetical protein
MKLFAGIHFPVGFGQKVFRVRAILRVKTPPILTDNRSLPQTSRLASCAMALGRVALSLSGAALIG